MNDHNNQTDIINDQNHQDNYMEERSTGEEIIESYPAILTSNDALDNKDGNAETQNDEDAKKFTFYVYGGNYPETVADSLIARGNWKQCAESESIEKSNFLWRPFNFPPESYKKIDKTVSSRNQSNPFIYNHFEVLKGLTTKSGLVRSLKQYYQNNESAKHAGYTAFDSSPTTFLLIAGQDDQEWAEFNQRYKDIQRGYAPKERIPIKHCVNNIWLVKPSNANQGRGIEIFSDLEEMQLFINSRPQFTCCVVQKYIERPLLFKGRKFDIRVWALFNCKNEVYMYKHGYLRTSSDDYNLTNGNNYVHLTNNCLQKFGDNYGIHEDGNTIGFEVFQKYLDDNFPQYNLSVQQHFIPRMKDLIIDTFNASKAQLNPNKRKNCFEFLGYDFLIDEDFRLWVIEVNTNPYFGIPNAFIADLLPKMMDDLLEIVVDPTYPPLNKPERMRPNDFELIYNDSVSNQVNQRRPFSISLYPVPDLAQLVGNKAARQDLKYLKQYKIQNLTLSTYTFKKQKEQNAKTMRRTATHSDIETTKRSRSVIQLIHGNKQKVQQQHCSQVSSPEKKSSAQAIVIEAGIGEGISRQSSKQRLSSGISRSNTVAKKQHQAKLTAQNAKLISKVTQSAISRASPPPSFANNNSHIKVKNFLNVKSSLNSTPEGKSAAIKQHPLIINADIIPVQTVESNSCLLDQQMPVNEDNQSNCGKKSDAAGQRSNSRGRFERSKSKTRDSSSQQRRRLPQPRTASILTKRQQPTADKSFDVRAPANNNVSRDFERYTSIVQSQAFDDVFSEIMTQIARESADSNKTKENLNMFSKIIEGNKFELQKNERFILDIIRLAVQDNQSQIITKSLFEIIQDHQERLHVKQLLVRNVTLQRQMLTFYMAPGTPIDIKQSLLNMLIALSCIDEPSRTQMVAGKNQRQEVTPKKRDVSENGGPFAQGRFASSPYSIVARPNSQIKVKPPNSAVPLLENSSLSSIRQGIFTRSLQNGLIMFLFNEIRKNNQDLNKLLKFLKVEEKQILINQLKSITKSEDLSNKGPSPPEIQIDIVACPEPNKNEVEKQLKEVEDVLNGDITLIDLSKNENKINVRTKGESLLAFVKSLITPESSDLLQGLLQQSNQREATQDTRNLNNMTTQEMNASENLFSPPPSKGVNRKPKMLKSFLGSTPEGPVSSQAINNQKQSHKSPFTTAIKIKSTPQQQNSSKQKKQLEEDQKSPPGPQTNKKGASKIQFTKHQVIAQSKIRNISVEKQVLKPKANEGAAPLSNKIKNQKFKPVLLKSKANGNNAGVGPSVFQNQNGSQQLKRYNPGQASMITIAANGQDLRKKSQLRYSVQTSNYSKKNIVHQSQTRLSAFNESSKNGKRRTTETQLSSYKRASATKHMLDLSTSSASYYLDASRTQFKKANGESTRGKLSETPSAEQIPMGNLQRAVLDQQLNNIDDKLLRVQSNCFEKIQNERTDLAQRMPYLPFNNQQQTKQPIDQVSQVSHGGDTGDVQNYLSENNQEFKMFQTMQNEEMRMSQKLKNAITIETEERFDYMPRLRHETLVATQSAKHRIPKIMTSSCNEDRPLQRPSINFHSKRQSMDQNIRMMKGKEIQEQHQQMLMLRPYVDDEP